MTIERSRFSVQLRAWGPAAAWAAVLFLLSALPYEADGGFLFELPDKAVHVALYSVLGAALAHARFHGAPGVPHWLMISIGAAYGVTDEWHQAFVPGRVPSVGDWLADVTGVAGGYVVAWLIVWALGRRHETETTGTTT